jgi:hypothetical protein
MTTPIGAPHRRPSVLPLPVAAAPHRRRAQMPNVEGPGVGVCSVVLSDSEDIGGRAEVGEWRSRAIGSHRGWW